ncbi:hypothetical protein T4B_13585 [Trichinella pseudospiralis]|uniref:Uncharacterized protein n=1 Tax=Trichinella pseudospiralis TaxID=6337 RepID=A0A0V1EGU8_TRIPS|nr:hypothetical protein T4A_3353 [Trichinella pseudospiralis]KRZ03074.1 hypothetical protein T4B_13585 [Trichinella pseudospiralis]
MKHINIARMMKIPSSPLNTFLAKNDTVESACNDGNSSSGKQIQDSNDLIMLPAYYAFPLSTFVFLAPQMNVLTRFYCI